MARLLRTILRHLSGLTLIVILLCATAAWDTPGGREATTACVELHVKPVFMAGRQSAATDQLFAGRSVRAWYRTPQGGVETLEVEYLGGGRAKCNGFEVGIGDNSEIVEGAQ